MDLAGQIKDGQWLGSFKGTNTGLAMLDLDRRGGELQGSLYAFDDNLGFPGIYAPISLTASDEKVSVTLRVEPIHPTQPMLLPRKDLPQGVNFTEELELSLSVIDNSLVGDWKGTNGTSGTVTFNASGAELPSAVEPVEDVHSWQSFQEHVLKLYTQPRRYIFRGQAAPWKLRTAFHRTSRKDLMRYWNDDVPLVHRSAIGKTSHQFLLGDPTQNGAFLHLLQHNGYPTPLLDWTYSPFVAAFFAFWSGRKDADKGTPVRIVMFDAMQWRKDLPQLVHITLCRPHFSLIEPLALGNDRALPQQSLASITNLDDIEEYIRFQEADNNKKYLHVFDLDPDERIKVLRMLSLMGISPGSMFPGLEGVCHEFRDRNFGPEEW